MCKHGDVFSLQILIGRSLFLLFMRPLLRTSFVLHLSLFFSSPVFMAKRFNPFPFRTRKLSSFTPTILDHLDLEKLGNAGSFQKVRSYGTNLFSLSLTLLLYGAWRFTEGYIFPFFRSYLTNLPLLWYNISCTYLLFLHVFFGPLAQLVRATGS